MERNITSEIKLEFDDRLVYRSPIGNKQEQRNINSEDFFKQNSLFREGIYIASCELYQEILRQLKDKKPLSEKLLSTLIKYRNRMENRSTPFGLFAGVSVVGWNGEASSDHQIMRRTVRLDSSCISQFMNYINSRASVIAQIKYVKNNSAYTILNNLKYVNYTNKRASYKNFTLITIKRNQGIDQVLNFCQHEAKSFFSIKEHLKSEGYLEEDAIDFVRLLIDEGLIVSEFQLRLTNTTNHLSDIISFVNAISGDEDLQKLKIILEQIRQLIADAERENENGDKNIERYEQIRKSLVELEFFELPRNFLQVDTYRQQNHQEINNRKELIEAVDLLKKIFYNTSSVFIGFKERFIKKYGNKPIAINEVLDPEIGIGYPYPTINQNLASQFPRRSNQAFELDEAERFLLKKLMESGPKSEEITITEQDVQTFSNRDKHFPASTSILFSSKQVNQTTTFLIKNVHSKSATNVLGRFSYVDKSIEALVKSICQHEDHTHPNKAIAEIVHFPSMERLGNVMFRKHFRRYEIPYISSPAKNASEIKLEDLYLWYNDNRLMLYSKKIKKEVIPYHSCAHNYNYDSLSLYKLLCDLTDQGNRFHFNWGKIDQMIKYFPRVKYKNVILSPRVWIIQVDTTKSMEFIQILTKEGVPNSFLICEGDNELLIELSNQEKVSLLKGFLKKGNTLTIKETFFSEENPDNEYVATLYNKGYFPSTSKYFKKNKNTQAIFSPGSEWVYYKIYVNINIANSIFIQHIYPLIKKWTKSGLIDVWFFIRYGDPDHHFRLRFKSRQPTAIIVQLRKKLDALRKKGLINDICLDSYERELERYGHHTIEFSETLFHQQSMAIAKVLVHEPSDIELYILALRVIMNTLKNFNFNVAEAKDFCERNREIFKQEILFAKKEKLFADTLYRNELKSAIKNFPNGISKELHTIVKDLDRRECEMAFHILNKLAKDDISRNSYCSSLIHMFVNRLFESNNRTHEFFLYYLLTKIYSDYKYLFNEKTVSI